MTKCCCFREIELDEDSEEWTHSDGTGRQCWPDREPNSIDFTYMAEPMEGGAVMDDPFDAEADAAHKAMLDTFAGWEGQARTAQDEIERLTSDLSAARKENDRIMEEFAGFTYG